MRTLFIGSTRRGFLALEALVEAGASICGILSLTQDDHEIERFEPAIRSLAESKGIPIRETRLLADPGLVDWLKGEIRAEVAFAVGVRVLMPETLFKALPRGCWAVHDSLLPAYRGFAPLNWAVINGESVTGVSLFHVTADFDAGDILLQQSVSIGDSETAPELYERICLATVDVVIEGHDRLLNHRVQLQVQDHTKATFTCSRTPRDGLIDWSKSTRTIFNLIRGLTFPYPGAFTYYRGEKLAVLSAELVPDERAYVGRIPGRVVQLHPGKGVDVLTGDGTIRLREIALEGKPRAIAADVIRSVRVCLGIDAAGLMDLAASLQKRASFPPSNLPAPAGVQPPGVAKPLPANPYNPFAWIAGNPEIGPGTWIGAFTLVDGLGGLKIGRGCNISSGAQILSHTTVRRCVTEGRQKTPDYKATIVGDFVFIGANAVVQMGASIGDHSVIGAGAMVLEDTVIPPYSLVVGVPARIVRDLRNEVGDWAQPSLPS